MRAIRHNFEFRASFSDLDEGLGILHQSIERLRSALGRSADDRSLMLFETALGEIGGNVLTHGRPADADRPVEYALRFEGGMVEASLTDSGQAAHEHLSRDGHSPDSSEPGEGCLAGTGIFSVSVSARSAAVRISFRSFLTASVSDVSSAMSSQ